MAIKERENFITVKMQTQLVKNAFNILQKTVIFFKKDNCYRFCQSKTTQVSFRKNDSVRDTQSKDDGENNEV